MIVKKKSKTKPSTKKPVKSSVKSSKNLSLKDRAKEKMSNKSGFVAMREAKKERHSNFSSWKSFYVRKGETKPFLFLTDNPVTVRVHNIKTRLPNGKEFFPEYLCSEDDDCVFCQEAQDGNKSVSNPSTIGVLLGIDVEGYTTKDDKEVPYVVRPLTMAPALSSVVEHRDMREGLLFTLFEFSKLDRGHQLDVMRDRKDNIQRFKNEKELLSFLRSDEGNKETAKLIKEALDKHGDFRTWLEAEIIPDFLNPEQANLKDTSSSSSDDDEGDDDSGGSSRYNFRKPKSGKKNKERKRSRLR